MEERGSMIGLQIPGEDMINSIFEVVAAGIVIPYLIWITVSIFNQRQEIALLKQSHDDLKDIIGDLKIFMLKRP